MGKPIAWEGFGDLASCLKSRWDPKGGRKKTNAKTANCIEFFSHLIRSFMVVGFEIRVAGCMKVA